jgi:hypothetical protein
MGTHFVQVNNLQILKKKFKFLYITTLDIFKQKKIFFQSELCFTDVNVQDYNELTYTINELRDTIEKMEDEDFVSFFIDWILDFSGKIRKITINNHTEDCIIRAVFDIIFKYAFDINYKISHVCSNISSFKKLQFEILRDCKWKIF